MGLLHKWAGVALPLVWLAWMLYFTNGSIYVWIVTAAIGWIMYFTQSYAYNNLDERRLYWRALYWRRHDDYVEKVLNGPRMNKAKYEGLENEYMEDH